MTDHPYRNVRLPAMRLTRTPHAARTAARTVMWFLLMVLIVLIATPWQQTAWGDGRVIAYAPVEREQRIEAPVEGRIAKWYVQDGSVVKEGDPIADISDNDPDIVVRLRGERAAVQKRLDAGDARKTAVEARAKALDASRTAALSAAKLRVAMARARVTAADKAVEAATAAEKTAKLNLDRQKALVEKGLASNRALELADLDYTRASTDLDRAKVASLLARSEELAIEADRLKVDADTIASLEDARATLAQAISEVANATVELQRIDVRLARQGAQAVKAPRAGTILRIVAKPGGEMVKPGDPLAIFVPTITDRAVELWVDGRDVPLIRVGNEVRLQFEGWPALQFSGWPSVAVGTFGGRIALVDATDDGKGRFRVLVTPDPNDPWPATAYLRPGVRAHGWTLLGRVRLGYELWRQFNGFPPAVAPPASKEAK